MLCSPLGFWRAGTLLMLAFFRPFCVPESGALPEFLAHAILQGQGNYSFYCTGGC